VLSNIFLHYVLDEWFIKQIQPLLKGESFLIRFADDFLLGFTNEEDAKGVMEVLGKRFERYGITLHPEKTKLIKLDGKDEDEGQGTFDFLGFTHYMSESRKGTHILKRKTSRKKLRGALVRMNKWLKENRHGPYLEGLIADLNRKLRGYYQYYGVTFNSRQLVDYYEQVKRMLFKWVNRRGAREHLTWERFALRINVWSPLEKPRIYHQFF